MSHTGASGDQGNPGTGATGGQQGQGQGQQTGSGSSGSSAPSGSSDSFDGNAALGTLLGDNSGSGTGDAGNSGGTGTGSGSGEDESKLPIEEQLRRSQGRADNLQRRARELEKERNKGAAAIKRLEAIDDAQKTEAQKSADRAATAERERDEALAHGNRILSAARHGLGPDLVEFLGTGEESEIDDRAKTLKSQISAGAADLINAMVERGELIRPGARRSSLGSRPVESLRPGGTPAGQNGQQEEKDLFRNMINTGRGSR
jgi:hypothetical protein